MTASARAMLLSMLSVLQRLFLREWRYISLVTLRLSLLPIYDLTDAVLMPFGKGTWYIGPGKNKFSSTRKLLSSQREIVANVLFVRRNASLSKGNLKTSPLVPLIGLSGLCPRVSNNIYRTTSPLVCSDDAVAVSPTVK